MPFTYINDSTVIPCEHHKTFEQLEPRCYIVRKVPMGMTKVTALVTAPSFKEPKFILSKDDKSSKIFKTFFNREKSTGVLLSGLKGTGKTFLAKEICRTGINEHSLPVILVDKYIDDLPTLLSLINQEVIVFFDEFEKIYNGIDSDDDDEDTNSQHQLLTLLDGIFEQKRLFIMTTNDTNKISDFVINRPGRCYYNFKFDRLEKEVIVEYCNLKLNNKDHLKEILLASNIIDGFSFDILTTIVDHYNLFDSIDYDDLNLIIDKNYNRGYYDVKVTNKKTNNVYYTCDHINIFDNYITIDLERSSYMYGFVDNKTYNRKQNDDMIQEIKLSSSDIISIEDDVVTYENDICIVVCTPSPSDFSLTLQGRINKIMRGNADESK